MGSSGTGNLTDYSGERPKKLGNGGHTGGSSGNDRCMRAISTSLDEVERSEYVQNHSDVPPVGTEVVVIFNIRLVVLTTDGEEIGYLPTNYNYLASCIEDGYSYTGQVISSRYKPVAAIMIDLVPHEPA